MSVTTSDYMEDNMCRDPIDEHADGLQIAAMLLMLVAVVLLVILLDILTPGSVLDGVAAPVAEVSRTARPHATSTELPERAGTKFDLLYNRHDLALP